MEIKNLILNKIGNICFDLNRDRRYRKELAQAEATKDKTKTIILD